MKISQAIQGYLIAKAADSYSESTLSGYKYYLNQIATRLEDKEISEVTQHELREYFYWLRTTYVPKRVSKNTEPLKSTSLRNAWCALRSFFGWAAKEFDFPRPDLCIKMPKVSYPAIIPIPKEDIAKLLSACEYTRETNFLTGKQYRKKRPTALRDMTIILLLLDTGVRVSECAHLTIKDVNLISGEVVINPHDSVRKNKSRIVYIGTVTKKALWRYLTSRGETHPDNPLFLTDDGQPVNRTSVREIIYKLGKKAGINHLYPHRFRHTFAIEYLRNGGDIFTLQRLLGHTTLSTVSHYLLIAKTDVEKAHRLASPVDRWNLK